MLRNSKKPYPLSSEYVMDEKTTLKKKEYYNVKNRYICNIQLAKFRYAKISDLAYLKSLKPIKLRADYKGFSRKGVVQ